MTTTAQAYRIIIRPTLVDLAARYNQRLHTPEAARLLVAIGLQEGRLIETKQLGPGRRPMEHLARGWWQFERGGGVAGVLRHRSTLWARHEIERLGYECQAEDVHYALAYDQRLATVCARALLWTDPRPLPSSEGAAWDCYIRTWRPGKPHIETWPRFWAEAGVVVG